MTETALYRSRWRRRSGGSPVWLRLTAAPRPATACVRFDAPVSHRLIGGTGRGFVSRELALVDEDNACDVIELGRLAGEFVYRRNDVVHVLVRTLHFGQRAGRVQQPLVAEQLVRLVEGLGYAVGEQNQPEAGAPE